MAISLAGNLVPKGGNTFYLLEDIYLKGGLQILPTLAARDAINPMNFKVGMLVRVLSEQKFYQLESVTNDVPVWTEFHFGGGGSAAGVRGVASASFTTYVEPSAPVLDADGNPIPTTEPAPEAEFPPHGTLQTSLAIGKTAIILKLEVSAPAVVAIYSDEACLNEVYRFTATQGNLVDYGLRPDAVVRDRQYRCYANMDEPPQSNCHVVLTNGSESKEPFTLTMTYLTLES